MSGASDADRGSETRAADPEAGSGSGSDLLPDADPGSDPEAERVEALELFFALALSRAADTRLEMLREEGHLPLTPLRPRLREAGVVAAAHAMRRRHDGSGDVLAPTRRAAGALRLLGTGLTDFFRDHVTGRVGSVHGNVTELHRVDMQTGMFAPVAPLGTLVEVMAGVTLAFRLRGEDRVGVVFDGDGASSTGAWHEGVVFAAARRCPMVLVVEAGPADPAYPRPRDSRLASFTEKGAGYGTPAASVDGADVLAVARVMRGAIDRARTGGGVQMVEVRYGTPTPEHDPLARLRTIILERDIATVDELDDIEREARERCEEAAGQASEEPLADRADDNRGIFAEDGPLDERRTWADPRAPRVM